MSIVLNHIIVPAREKWTSARFLASILGLEVGSQWGPFVPLRTSNGVTVDFVERLTSRHIIAPSWLTIRNSTRRLTACATLTPLITLISCASAEVKSIISTAAAECISIALKATCSK